ncbi:hypothetical protein F5051DRAFT_435825 [Lentinula edodes]|nr:hypothetical protein F5051DRAFT_435825 [Lentinula edodes]
MSNVVFPPYASSLCVQDSHYGSSLQGFRTPSKPKRSTRPLGPSLQHQFSPEYTMAIHQSSRGPFGRSTSRPYEENDVARDVQYALRAQERARMRKATLESSTHSKRVHSGSSSIAKPQVLPLSDPDVGPATLLDHSLLIPIPKMSPASANAATDVGPNFQEPRHPVTSERVRMRSFRFPRVKDSISLPYLQNRRRNTPPSSHRTSAMDDLPPPVPQLPQFRNTYPPAVATENSPKHIVPLPRFDPFSRPRADSLSSLVEARSSGVETHTSRRSPSTVRTARSKQVSAVSDIFSNINRQAASLGVKTCV